MYIQWMYSHVTCACIHYHNTTTTSCACLFGTYQNYPLKPTQIWRKIFTKWLGCGYSRSTTGASKRSNEWESDNGVILSSVIAYYKSHTYIHTHKHKRHKRTRLIRRTVFNKYTLLWVSIQVEKDMLTLNNFRQVIFIKCNPVFLISL